jgi:hypothetical protein
MPVWSMADFILFSDPKNARLNKCISCFHDIRQWVLSWKWC